MIHVTANAKLNLSLEIIGRRDDGFHELVSVMQAINLADELVALPAPDGSITLECNDPALADSADNTVLTAARLLKDAAGVEQGARLLLRKSIPVAAGLGGGSADGAAALVALARLWNVAVPHDRLMDLAAAVGSDVPFFLGESPTALVEGRGETITALPSLPQAWAVILIPEVPVPSPKTRVLFRMLDESNFSDGERTMALRRLVESGAGRVRDFGGSRNDKHVQCCGGSRLSKDRAISRRFDRGGWSRRKRQPVGRGAVSLRRAANAGRSGGRAGRAHDAGTDTHRCGDGRSAADFA